MFSIFSRMITKTIKVIYIYILLVSPVIANLIIPLWDRQFKEETKKLPGVGRKWCSRTRANET